MDTITTILAGAQEQLGRQVPELACIDKDRDQWTGELPADRFPCALLDMKEATYSQLGNGCQMADLQITVTVAALHGVQAPVAGEAYSIFGLLDRVHTALQLFETGNCSPLCRTRLRKVAADGTRECYEMTYRAACPVDCDAGGSSLQGVRATIQLQP